MESVKAMYEFHEEMAFAKIKGTVFFYLGLKKMYKEHHNYRAF